MTSRAPTGQERQVPGRCVRFFYIRRYRNHMSEDRTIYTCDALERTPRRCGPYLTLAGSIRSSSSRGAQSRIRWLAVLKVGITGVTFFFGLLLCGACSNSARQNLPDAASKDQFALLAAAYASKVSSFSAVVDVQGPKLQGHGTGFLYVVLPDSFYLKLSSTEVLRIAGKQYLKDGQTWLLEPSSANPPIGPLDPVAVYRNGVSPDARVSKSVNKVGGQACDQFDVGFPGLDLHESYCFDRNGWLLQYVVEDNSGNRTAFRYSEFNIPIALATPVAPIVPTRVPATLRQ
jgi:hypothetical protein